MFRQGIFFHKINLWHTMRLLVNRDCTLPAILRKKKWLKRYYPPSSEARGLPAGVTERQNISRTRSSRTDAAVADA